MEKKDMEEFLRKMSLDIRKDIKDELKVNIKAELQPLVGRMDKMEAKVEESENRLERYERERRENNIIIYNMIERGEETWEDLQKNVIDFLGTLLHVNIKEEDITRITRLGQNRSKARPVLIRFVRYNTKTMVLKNRNRLKGSTIRIDEDFSQVIRQKRKNLLPELAKLRQEGKAAWLKYDKIVVKQETRTNMEHRNNPEDQDEDDLMSEEARGGGGTKRGLSLSPEDSVSNKQNHLKQFPKRTHIMREPSFVNQQNIQTGHVLQYSTAQGPLTTQSGAFPVVQSYSGQAPVADNSGLGTVTDQQTGGPDNETLGEQKTSD
uniref:L1 transposable element RRM domain-containing protein n=1 Tax=Cacopsylla melanoneura TaxID=428564 RepID=A0A8D9E6X4_9HEMI